MILGQIQAPEIDYLGLSPLLAVLGGSIVVLTRAGRRATAARQIRDAYQERTGRIGVVLVPPPPTAA